MIAMPRGLATLDNQRTHRLATRHGGSAMANRISSEELQDPIGYESLSMAEMGRQNRAWSRGATCDI
jgi:hypothetical protein